MEEGAAILSLGPSEALRLGFLQAGLGQAPVNEEHPVGNRFGFCDVFPLYWAQMLHPVPCAPTARDASPLGAASHQLTPGSRVQAGEVGGFQGLGEAFCTS